MRSLTLALMTVLCSAALAAQERDTQIERAGLPRDVAREATRLFNETAAMRSTGRVEIDEDKVVDGDLAVLNGPVLISGRVKGRVLAINSDVILRSTARIDGDLLVVGGEVEGRHTAYVGGEIRIYRQHLQYTRDGENITPERVTVSEETGWWRRWERTQRRSGSKLQIASAGAYNRVEGLPINLGPQIYRNAPWGSARLDAYAVLRTETSFGGNQDDIGHNVNAEVRFGRRGGLLVGGRAFNVVEPVENWQLTNLEAGLTAFLLHRDYRDYYERHGGRVRAGFFVRRGADISVSYGDERWYARLSRVFNHSFKRKPIVLYANAADFHQTTTTGGTIGEGTGGFTDAFMNRVVLPLTGSYAENDHVLGHEIVHVFQYDIAANAAQNRRRFNLEQLPLWLVEGMAEYFSKGRIDPLTAMWIRDATIHDRMPNLKALIRNGTTANVQTIQPTVSPMLWTTVGTGLAPDRHGVIVEPLQQLDAVGGHRIRTAR